MKNVLWEVSRDEILESSRQDLETNLGAGKATFHSLGYWN